jgi:hypothetical protein
MTRVIAMGRENVRRGDRCHAQMVGPPSDCRRRASGLVSGWSNANWRLSAAFGPPAAASLPEEPSA